MGMTCYFVAVSDKDTPLIAADPAILLGLGDEQHNPDLVAKLGINRSGQDWQPILPPKTLFVDKAWDGINYLLTKAGGDGDFPYSFVTEGGTEIQTDAFTHGPPRFFHSDEVKEIARTFKDLDIDAFYDETEPEEFAEADVYPNIWNQPKAECLHYIMDHLTELKSFILDAADKHLALIVYLA
jgi:hypothetical protein